MFQSFFVLQPPFNRTMVAFTRPKGIKAREVPDVFKWSASARRADVRLDRAPLCSRCMYSLASREENCNKGALACAHCEKIKQGSCTKVGSRQVVTKPANTS